MNYDTLVMASKLAALGIFLPLYVGFLVYAYWGPNREKLQAYATNLGDLEYVASVKAGLRYAGAPRQYGLRLTRSF